MVGRRYSGYDEYEGIFGPLNVYGTTGSHSHSTTSGFSGPRATSNSRRSSRWHANAPSRLASFGRASSDLNTRAKYLDGRRTKRRLKPFDIDADAEEDSECEGDVHPLAPPAAAPDPQPPSQRQVWLPTRNFSFRQRAGKLDMRAIARLDLVKIVATTDIDAIQRHLENVAFADVTLDDVQHYSDAYFLKLFQIAQLTLEYLLNVQDSLVTHSEGVESQCEELLGECQQLETDNSAFEAEIAGLKKEIRLKQRTMATFEVMLLNASASNRRVPRALAGTDKENAAAEANAIVGKFLGGSAAEDEDGVVNKPVDCVVCGKKFLSAEYLIRHQQRKHQNDSKNNKKKTRKKKRPSSSSSSSSSDTKSKSKGVKTAPLPPQVIQALEEKNELARQFLNLQEQLKSEREARDQQTQLLNGQQSQLTAHVVENMGKLQSLLLEMEKKQEMTKHDMMQYTQETIQRLQTEAVNAQLLAKKATKSSSSRAGTIQSDDEDREPPVIPSKRPKDGEWQETQLEKMLEVFFKAQTQQQHEIDALAQENSKLLSKTRAKHRHHRPYDSASSSSLMQMAALDAQRFGIDNGDLGREENLTLPIQPFLKVVLQEDKLVQTDEEDDSGSNLKRAMTTHEVQTDAAREAEPRPVKVPPPAQPLRRNTVNATLLQQPKPEPVAKSMTAIMTQDPPSAPEEAQPPIEESDPSADKEKRLRHAAQVVGRVALGFLTRRTLQNPANWLITLPFAALESALSKQELSHHASSRELVIEVASSMTANELRVAVARGLSGEDQQEDDETDSTELLIDYHRVLLHHTVTREELHGDRPIHTFRNQIEVEIIPSYQEAEDHVEGVFEFHSDVTDRLQRIRRTSMELPEADHLIGTEAVEESRLRRLVRLQARVRGLLAKRKVAILKIDQLVEKRLVKMRTVAGKRQPLSLGGDGISDPIIAAQCKRIHEQLAAAVKSKLLSDKKSQRPSGSDNVKKKISTRIGLSTASYEQQLLILERERSQLPVTVQTRISSISERLEQLVTSEYDPRKAKAHERRTDTANKIQSAVQVAIARRQLQILLAGSRDRQLAVETGELQTPRRSMSSSSASVALTPFSPLSALSSDDEPVAKSSHEDLKQEKEEELEDFDAHEIAKLADAYEADEKLSNSIALPIGGGGGDEKQSPERKLPVKELELLEEKKLAVVRRIVTRQPPVQQLTSIPRHAPESSTNTIPPRAATPIRHVEAAAEPGRSPRPKLDNKEVISPFSRTPLLSRRSGAVTRHGSGYDNAR